MAVSFSGAAKAEVCRIMPGKRCCALAECFGILLFCNSFGADGIKIITESREFAYILPKLFKKATRASLLATPVEEVGVESFPPKIRKRPATTITTAARMIAIFFLSTFAVITSIEIPPY